MADKTEYAGRSYLPARNADALFSIGDGHAAQGDGEVDSTAIETTLAGTFEPTARKGLGWKRVRTETPTTTSRSPRSRSRRYVTQTVNSIKGVHAMLPKRNLVN